MGARHGDACAWLQRQRQNNCDRCNRHDPFLGLGLGATESAYQRKKPYKVDQKESCTFRIGLKRGGGTVQVPREICMRKKERRSAEFPLQSSPFEKANGPCSKWFGRNSPRRKT